jgi:hypothetical protein
MDGDDAKFLYLAYRLGDLPSLWKLETGLDPAGCLSALDEIMQSNYQFAWSVRDGAKTLVIAYGISGLGAVLIGDVIWHRKTTKRQKIEAAAALFNYVKQDAVAVITSEYKHRAFYEKLVNNKILRRVGTLYDITEKDYRVLVFQTRA